MSLEDRVSPRLRVDDDVLGSHLYEVVDIPLGAPLSAQRQILRNPLHYGCVHPVHVVMLRSDLGIALADLGVLLVVDVQVVVAVEDHQLASGPDDPEPLLVRGPGGLQVPDEVPGYHDVEGVVVELQMLCVHAPELRIHTEPGAVLPGLIEHRLRVVDGGHAVALPSQDDGEESRAAPDIQYPEVPSLWEMFLDDPEPVPVATVLDLLQYRLGVAVGPEGPVALYLVQIRFHDGLRNTNLG